MAEWIYHSFSRSYVNLSFKLFEINIRDFYHNWNYHRNFFRIQSEVHLPEFNGVPSIYICNRIRLKYFYGSIHTSRHIKYQSVGVFRCPKSDLTVVASLTISIISLGEMNNVFPTGSSRQNKEFKADFICGM